MWKWLLGTFWLSKEEAERFRKFQENRRPSMRIVGRGTLTMSLEDAHTARKEMINREKNIQFIKKTGFDKVFNTLNKAPEQTTHINAYNRYISVVSEHQMFEFSERLGWSHYHQREEIYSLVELKQIVLSETKVTV